LPPYFAAHTDQDRPDAFPVNVENCCKSTFAGHDLREGGRAMVATFGDVKFSRKGALAGGTGKSPKNALAHDGKHKAGIVVRANCLQARGRCGDDAISGTPA
jgi:hypothetical protein